MPITRCLLGGVVLGSILLLQVLIACSCSNSGKEFSDSFLRSILQEGDTNALAEFLESGGSANRRISLRKRVPVEEPLLNVSVRADHIHGARMLVEHGADIEGKDWQGNTPLMSALLSEEISDVRVKVVEWLLGQGANVLAKNSEGYDPLDIAVIASSPRMVEMLLLYGADVNSTNSVGQTPLHLCQDKQVGAILLANGSDPDLHDLHGRTPLDQAVAQRKEQMIELLQY